MNIGEIRIKKIKTEKAIEKLIDDFIEQTGLDVQGLNYQLLDISTMGLSKKTAVSDISMDVCL